MAKKDSGWGYDRLEGALKNLGHINAPTTIRNILHRRGLEPAPLRKPKVAWKTFLKAHWSSLAAAVFFTTEVWTSRGLVTFYTLFLIDLATRAVHIAGTTPSPDGAFMKQIARNSPMWWTASSTRSDSSSWIATASSARPSVRSSRTPRSDQSDARSWRPTPTRSPGSVIYRVLGENAAGTCPKGGRAACAGTIP